MYLQRSSWISHGFCSFVLKNYWKNPNRSHEIPLNPMDSNHLTTIFIPYFSFDSPFEFPVSPTILLAASPENPKFFPRCSLNFGKFSSMISSGLSPHPYRKFHGLHGLHPHAAAKRAPPSRGGCGKITSGLSPGLSWNAAVEITVNDENRGWMVFFMVN